MIKSNTTDLNELFAEWYKLYYRMVENLVVDKVGKRDVVKDIFHDSLMVLYEKIIRNELHITVKMSTYLYSIANNKCHEYLRKQLKENNVSFNEEIEMQETSGYDTTRETLIKKLEHCLEKLSDTKRNIMISYYYHKLKMNAIASKHNLENSNSVKTQKYKAINDLKNCIKKQKTA